MKKDNREQAEIIFKEELAYIKSKSIRDLVLKCFDKLTPDYFWDFSASSSNKYHPKVANKKHGIVLHTKLCVWWGSELSLFFDSKEIDIIIAALLLHDLQKFGKSLDKNNKPTLAECTTSHGPLLAIQIENLFECKVNEEVKKDIKLIITCVAMHMGRWTNKTLSYKWEEDSNNISIKIVQLADYCASRKVDDKMEELDNYKFPN